MIISRGQDKILKVFLIGIFFLLLAVSLEIYREKRYSEWSLQVAHEIFSGPSIKRIPLKNIFSVAPADPQTNKNALDLLKYFYILSSNQKGNFLLSGQNIGGINGYESISEGYTRYFKALEDQTGKLPVIMGIDYGWERLLEDYTEVNKILIDYWRKGGLIEVSISPSNPFTGNGLRDFGLGEHRYEDLFTAGNQAHDRWMADLDKVASGLKQLQNAGVVVLWRPLHEMNGDWFWWSYGENGRASQEEYVKLWKQMFDYLTRKKGLHNLVWIYAPNATFNNSAIKPAPYYYPGDQYVDITGLDYYSDDMTKVNDNGSYDAMVELGKPFGLTEIGPQKRDGFDNAMVVRAIERKYPQTVFVMYWQGWTRWGVFQTKRAIVENQNAKEFMNDPLIITLDKNIRENPGK